MGPERELPEELPRLSRYGWCRLASMTLLGQFVAVFSLLDCSAVLRVALIPACEECRKLWLPGDDERWRAYWIDDGEEDQLLFYCRDCAEREFV